MWVSCSCFPASYISLSMTSFTVIIVFFVLLSLGFLALALILGLKLKRRGEKVDDAIELTVKPQRFSLPRTQIPTHMRL